MRLGRPRFSKCWPLRHHQITLAWDGVGRGLGIGQRLPLRALRFQVRSGDLLPTAQDLGLVKMGAFLEELLRFGLQPTSQGLVHSVSNRRRRVRKTAQRPGGPAKQYVYYSTLFGPSTLPYVWQFFVERLLAYVRRKQLPLRLVPRTGFGFSWEVQELTPFLSGSESLYLQLDYFDWEDVQLHLQGLVSVAGSKALVRYFSAYKFPLVATAV